MRIYKDSLRDVEIRIDKNCEDGIIDLLNNWCGEDYKIFGGILDLVENINSRVFLMGYDGISTFITFDDHSNLFYVDLEVGDEKTIAINKYDQRYVYSFTNDNNTISLDEKIEERIDDSVVDKKRRLHMI